MRALAVLIASLLLIACPGNRRREDESKTALPKTSTTTTNPQTVPERGGKTMIPIAPPARELPSQRINAAARQLIQVQLIEYEIRIPDTLPAGHQTFHVANAGKMNHNFAIEGNGIATKLPSDLLRGDTADIAVDLTPGTYVVYCPVDKHRGRGMERRVTVR